MLTDLGGTVRALAELISEISQASWYAGWMKDIEYDIWAALEGDEIPFRRLGCALTADRLARLRQLSSDCGGWIAFREDTEETWVPIDEWRREYRIRRDAGRT